MNSAYREQGDHVMSWRKQWTLDNPVRGWVHPPRKLFAGLVEPGMTVVDTGCGTGFFSLHLARMVGDKGTVMAVDLQPEALARVEEKAEMAGVSGIIETSKCEQDNLGRLPKVDFALSFYMAHETPDIAAYFTQMAECIRPGGRLLLVEPWFHVKRDNFAVEVTAACNAGFEVEATPAIRMSHATLLRRA